LAYRHEYDVDKVRRELEAFPESMFEEWLENREQFVTKLLYMHIPREVLWQLVSGIAFVEALKVCEQVQEDEDEDEDEQETIAERILQLPTVELQYEAYQQVTALLTGTSWDTKAAEVLEAMFAKVKEQQDRQEQKQDMMMKTMKEAANKPTTQNIYGDKNELLSGAQLLKMTIPQGVDPAEVTARIIEQQKALLGRKENKSKNNE